MKSKFGFINLRDAINGFVVAFLASALSAAIQVLDAGRVPTLHELKGYLIIGLTAGISYLMKNIVTNSKGEILKKETQK